MPSSSDRSINLTCILWLREKKNIHRDSIHQEFVRSTAHQPNDLVNVSHLIRILRSLSICCFSQQPHFTFSRSRCRRLIPLPIERITCPFSHIFRDNKQSRSVKVISILWFVFKVLFSSTTDINRVNFRIHLNVFLLMNSYRYLTGEWW